MTTTTYFVTTDSDDFTDDNGDYQVSLLTQKVSSPTTLTNEEVWENACAEGNWEIHFGQGEEKTLGEYQVELCN